MARSCEDTANYQFMAINVNQKLRWLFKILIPHNREKWKIFKCYVKPHINMSIFDRGAYPTTF